MFTGIIEELGEVVALTPAAGSARIAVHGPLVTADAVRGASIAVNGVCLTVTDAGDDVRQEGIFHADVMAQTLNLTSLGGLAAGAPVNLERSMPAAGRFGGHIVQGHVDGVGTVLERRPGPDWEVVRVSCPAHLLCYVVPQGSIALDGVSLTVVDVDEAETTTDTGAFTVSLIPQTLSDTTLGDRPVGARLNLEVDVLAKYVERLLPPRP